MNTGTLAHCSPACLLLRRDRYHPYVGSPERANPPLRLVVNQRESEVVAPKPLLDDDAIVRGVPKGDPAAILALYDRARSIVDRTIYRVLGRHDHEHDDLAQLSMIQLVDSFANYRRECSLDTWISRVTAFTVMKELPKRKTRRGVFSDTEVDDAMVASSNDVERQVVCRDSLARIREHLDALDPAKSWAVVLHDVCGYDLEEIAKITEVSVAAAQTRLSRGRRELHARIANDPELADMLRERARKP